MVAEVIFFGVRCSALMNQQQQSARIQASAALSAVAEMPTRCWLSAGLLKSNGLSWRPEAEITKLLVHIADCPGHGCRYHDFGAHGDHHTADEPLLLPAVKAIKALGTEVPLL